MTERNISHRDALIEEYHEFTGLVVRKMIRTMGLPIDLYDEFLSAGYMGLVEAAERYRPETKVPFRPFAYLRIRGSVIDSIRSHTESTGKAYRFARALQAAHSMREDEAEAALESKDFAESEQPTLASVLDFAAKSALAFRLTLVEAEHELTESAQLPDTETTMISRENTQDLVNLISSLPDKERLIIEEYYVREKSFAEIVASHEGYNKSWVSKIHKRALSMLKERYEMQKISHAADN